MLILLTLATFCKKLDRLIYDRFFIVFQDDTTKPNVYLNSVIPNCTEESRASSCTSARSKF